MAHFSGDPVHIVSENAPADLLRAVLEALGSTNASSIIGQDGDARLGGTSTFLTLAELRLTKFLLQHLAPRSFDSGDFPAYNVACKHSAQAKHAMRDDRNCII